MKTKTNFQDTEEISEVYETSPRSASFGETELKLFQNNLTGEDVHQRVDSELKEMATTDTAWVKQIWSSKSVVKCSSGFITYTITLVESFWISMHPVQKASSRSSVGMMLAKDHHKNLWLHIPEFRLCSTGENSGPKCKSNNGNLELHLQKSPWRYPWLTQWKYPPFEILCNIWQEMFISLQSCPSCSSNYVNLFWWNKTTRDNKMTSDVSSAYLTGTRFQCLSHE